MMKTASKSTHKPQHNTSSKYAPVERTARRPGNVTNKKKTRNSAIADKPARRVYRSVKVTKHSTIPYVRYSFLLCNSNLSFYDIRPQKCRDLEIGSEVTQGHWKCYYSIHRVWFSVSVL